MTEPLTRPDVLADRELMRRTFITRQLRTGQMVSCKPCGSTWWITVADTRAGISLQLLEHARAHELEAGR